MFSGVGQRFLRDAKQRQPSLPMQRRECRRKVQLRRYAAIFGPVLDVILQRDGEPEVVEKNRTQTGEDAALRAHRRLEQSDPLLLFVYQIRGNFPQLFLQASEP